MVRGAANSTPSRVDALMARIQGRRRGTSGREPLETTAGLARFRAVPTGEGCRQEIFSGNRGTPREVAHWRWRNELYDPLSSFVPELEPRRRRGFSFGGGPRRRKPKPDPSRLRHLRSGIPRSMTLGSAEITPCGRDRGRAKFPFCSLPSSSGCAGGPFDRASRAAPARRRPRSACHLPELDG